MNFPIRGPTKCTIEKNGVKWNYENEGTGDITDFRGNDKVTCARTYSGGKNPVREGVEFDLPEWNVFRGSYHGRLLVPKSYLKGIHS